MSAPATTAPTNDIQSPATQNLPAKPTCTKEFKRQVKGIAMDLLASWVGEDRANEAIGRITAALTASVASARDPADFFACTTTSIAGSIALAALTGIMPGVGSTALAYVIPQRARKNEAPQLTYRLSHRGVNALARRCGQTMIPIPVSLRDTIRTTTDGEVEIVELDADNPPMTHEDLRGVLILVKELESGKIIHRGWVPKLLIEKRRAMSQSWSSTYKEYSPWVKWPVEQAIKTAMHYAIGRGWCIIDDTQAARALQAESEQDIIIEGSAREPVPMPRAIGEAPDLGGEQPPKKRGRKPKGQEPAPPTSGMESQLQQSIDHEREVTLEAIRAEGRRLGYTEETWRAVFKAKKIEPPRLESLELGKAKELLLAMQEEPEREPGEEG